MAKTEKKASDHREEEADGRHRESGARRARQEGARRRGARPAAHAGVHRLLPALLGQNTRQVHAIADAVEDALRAAKVQAGARRGLQARRVGPDGLLHVHRARLHAADARLLLARAPLGRCRAHRGVRRTSAAQLRLLLRPLADGAVAVLLAPVCARLPPARSTSPRAAPSARPAGPPSSRSPRPAAAPAAIRCRRGGCSASRKRCARAAAAGAARLAGARDRALRRDAARDRPRAEVRPPCRRIARHLAARMRDAGAEVLAGADLVVPVPLHRSRERARGFNQARELARHLGLPVADALVRTRQTRVAGGSAGGAASRQRARRVRAGGRGVARRRTDDRPGGRREHDGRDAERVRARAAGRRGGGSARAYGGAAQSSGATAVSTSAATTSFGALAVEAQPAGRCRLAAIALAHARQQREVALVLVAVRRLAAGRGFGRDVEQDRQVGRRQVPLDLAQPRARRAPALRRRRCSTPGSDRRSTIVPSASIASICGFFS